MEPQSWLEAVVQLLGCRSFFSGWDLVGCTFDNTLNRNSFFLTLKIGQSCPTTLIPPTPRY